MSDRDIIEHYGLPAGLPDCAECFGAGWVEPLDLPKDTVIATLGLEPCPDCDEASGVADWYVTNRSRLAGIVI